MKGRTCFRIFGRNFFILTALLFPLINGVQGQSSFLLPSDTLDRTRFWSLTGGLGAAYTISLYKLNEEWYDNYERSSLHSFDDLGEWKDVDKGGHLFASYMQSQLVYSSYRWAGSSDENAAILGAAWSFSGQLGFELLDGHTEKWGFSWYDLLYNTAGSGLFLAQQLYWKEQRIRIKYSIYPVDHPDILISGTEDAPPYPLSKRVSHLYGNGLERFLKDYNGHTVWLSVNPSSFLKNETLPSWLNIALGYGAKDLYGGFHNKWAANGEEYSFPSEPVSQFYLSPDIDFHRIETESTLLRIFLDLTNFIKPPLPTLEYQSDGRWQWHWIFF